jgi:hypothetical protein
VVAVHVRDDADSHGSKYDSNASPVSERRSARGRSRALAAFVRSGCF